MTTRQYYWHIGHLWVIFDWFWRRVTVCWP